MKKFILNVALVAMMLSGISLVQACCSDEPSEEISRDHDKWDYRSYYAELLASDEWKSYNNYMQRLEVCQVPEAELAKFSTEELVDICLVYPFRVNIFAYNHRMDGYRSAFDNFNAYSELMKRDDAASTILRVYESAQIGHDTLRPDGSVCPTVLGFPDDVVVEGMLACGDFPELYEAPLLTRLDKIAHERLAYKQERDKTYSSLSWGFLYDICARIDGND